MKRDMLHVMRCEAGGWEVRRAGADGYDSIHPTREEAIDAAVETSKRDKLGLVIHAAHETARRNTVTADDA